MSGCGYISNNPDNRPVITREFIEVPAQGNIEALFSDYLVSIMNFLNNALGDSDEFGDFEIAPMSRTEILNKISLMSGVECRYLCRYLDGMMSKSPDIQGLQEAIIDIKNYCHSKINLSKNV